MERERRRDGDRELRTPPDALSRLAWPESKQDGPWPPQEGVSVRPSPNRNSNMISPACVFMSCHHLLDPCKMSCHHPIRSL